MKVSDGCSLCPASRCELIGNLKIDRERCTHILLPTKYTGERLWWFFFLVCVCLGFFFGVCLFYIYKSEMPFCINVFC